MGGVWVVLGWCLGGDSNWLASFKDVAGVLRLLPRLRLLHGFLFWGGVVAYVEAGTRILRLLPYS